MKKNDRKIPRRNYTIVFTIIVMTLIISTTLFVIVNNQRNYEKTIPVLRNYSKELELNDLDAYCTENQDLLLYIGSSSDEVSRKLEEELIDVIEENDLEVIYLNIKDVKNKGEFYSEFNKKYSNGIDLKATPAFLIIKEGKLLDLVQNDYRHINSGDVIQLLELNEMLGEKDD